MRQIWEQTPVGQAAHGNRVVVHACVCMPDHFHGVIEVLEPMQWSLGDIMQAFKAACTSQWQQQQGLSTSTNRPISADCLGPDAPEWLREKALKHSDEGSLIRHLSKKQRQEYYALVGRQQRPLCRPSGHGHADGVQPGQSALTLPCRAVRTDILKNYRMRNYKNRNEERGKRYKKSGMRN